MESRIRIKARAPRADAEWLTSAEAAYYLGVTPQTLYRWRWLGTAPRAQGDGALVRYRRADLDAWLCDRTQGDSSTSAAGAGRVDS